jgi:hypothetical protein
VKIWFFAANLLTQMKEVLRNKRGDTYVDTAIKILIAVVLGGLLLAGLYKLFTDVVLPNLSESIQDMFNYSG